MFDFILRNFNFLLNQVLRLDPELSAQLSQFSNQSLHIDISNMPVPSLYFLFFEDKVCLTSEKPSQVNVHVTADLKAFVEILIKKITKENALPSNIHMQGDVEFAQAVFRFFNQFEIDWEEQIAKICGDTIASKIGQGIRDVAAYTRNSVAIFSQNLREYLQEEIQYLTSRLEIEDFNLEIDHLRIDTDRLEARIARLNQKENH